MKRQVMPANTPWASELCYSRAVRVGSFVAVSQTSAADEHGSIQGGADPYAQATYAQNNVEAALHQVGARWKDVVRTRIYLAKLVDWKEVARARAERFSDVRPSP